MKRESSKLFRLDLAIRSRNCGEGYVCRETRERGGGTEEGRQRIAEIVGL